MQAVKKSIEKTYTSTDIKADGQIIQVRFTDKIDFEVLPAIINQDGKTYTHADANNGGSWKVTDPKAEIDAINGRNKECNGNLKMLCKMMRAWARNMDVPIKGILIDTLAYQFLENYTYRDKNYFYYDLFTRDFFSYLKQQDKEQTKWRAPGSGRIVENKEDFRWKATRGYNIAIEAINYNEKVMEYRARVKWREIYGPKYPD